MAAGKLTRKLFNSAMESPSAFSGPATERYCECGKVMRPTAPTSAEDGFIKMLCLPCFKSAIAAGRNVEPIF